MSNKAQIHLGHHRFELDWLKITVWTLAIIASSAIVIFTARTLTAFYLGR